MGNLRKSLYIIGEDDKIVTKLLTKKPSKWISFSGGWSPKFIFLQGTFTEFDPYID
jgi:hypothetical protein